MRIDLRTVKDNPMRDFAVDPINDELVAQLRKSIKEDGFWSGIVARKRKGQIELAAGHHRLRAALAEGITHADIAVGDYDDLGMIRVYARENATQRGNSSTAMTGAVAAAIRFILKPLITGHGLDSVRGGEPARDFTGAFDSVRVANLRANLDRDLDNRGGIGEDVITWLLAPVPGITNNAIRGELSNLKASGDYARIAAAINAEIEEETREALAKAAEQERLRLEWEAEQKRQEEERERQRKEAEEKRRQAEIDRRLRIAEAERKQKAAEEARKKAEAERKAAREEAAREKARLEAERRKAEAEREKERIAEERRQAQIERERQKKLAAEQAERDRAEKALAEKRRKEIEKQSKQFEAARRASELSKAQAAKAAAKEVTFDHHGVAKHFKVKEHVNAFRRVATSEGVKPYLPVDKQAAWAAELARRAGKGELTSDFIRNETINTYLFAKSQERALDREDQRRLELASIDAKMARLIEEFARNGRGMASAAAQMKEMMDTYPNHRWKFTQGFRNAVHSAKSAIDTLYARM